MICRICGSEISSEYFDICPYCLTPLKEDKKEGQSGLDSKNDEDNEYIEAVDARQMNDVLEFGEEYQVTTGDLLGEKHENEYQITTTDLMHTKSKAEKEIAVERLDLSVRALNVIKKEGINTLGELVEFLRTHEISKLRNVGNVTANEMKKFLKKYQDGEKVIGEKQYETSESTNYYPFKENSIETNSLDISVLESFGFTSKTINKLTNEDINKCGELRTLTESDLKKIVGYNAAKKMQKLVGLFKCEVATILKDMLDKKRDSNAYNAFIRRAQGETLQEIADDFGATSVTRERIRQLEKVFYYDIKPLLLALLKILKGLNNYVSQDELLEVYDDDEYDQIVLYGSRKLNEFEFLDFADVFVEKLEDTSVTEDLRDTLLGVVGEATIISEIREIAEDAFTSKGYNFVSDDVIKRLLKKNGYCIYGDLAVKGKSYTLACLCVIEKYFPNGIKLTQSEFDTTDDIDKLRKIINDKYAGVVLPSNSRTLSAALVRGELVLRDHGKYISPKYVYINKDLMNEVKKYIDTNENNKIFYQEIFAEFEGALSMLSGIDNYAYLHGVLSMLYPNDYTYCKDYLLKNKEESDSNDSIAERIYSFICERRRAVSKSELCEAFNGLSSTMLELPFTYDSRLIAWGYGYYNCIDNLRIDNQDIQDIKMILSDLFNENRGYATCGLVYNKIMELKSDFLKKNNIDSELIIYHILKKLFDGEIIFKKPHMLQKEIFDINSIKDLAMYVLDNRDYFTYEEFIEIAGKYKWPIPLQSAMLREIEDDYVRIDINKYAKKSKLVLTTEILNRLEVILKEKMHDGILPLVEVDTDKLPDWEYTWNDFILESVICIGIPQLKVIQPNRKDRRVQKGIIVTKCSQIETYSQAVVSIMKAQGCNKFTESQLFSFLVVNNLARKVIPSELIDSGYFVKEKDYYLLVQK